MLAYEYQQLCRLEEQKIGGCSRSTTYCILIAVDWPAYSVSHSFGISSRTAKQLADVGETPPLVAPEVFCDQGPIHSN